MRSHASKTRTGTRAPHNIAAVTDVDCPIARALGCAWVLCVRPPHLFGPPARRPLWPTLFPPRQTVRRHISEAEAQCTAAASAKAAAGMLTAECDKIKHAARVARLRGTLSSLKKREMNALDALVGLGRFSGSAGRGSHAIWLSAHLLVCVYVGGGQHSV